MINEIVKDILAITPGEDVKLTDWFDSKLRKLILLRKYPNVGELAAIKQSIVDELIQYKDEHKLNDVVIGMSGGVDSALTAALFKDCLLYTSPSPRDS